MKAFTRSSVLAGFIGLVFLITPVAGRAQNYRNCAWPITSSPEGYGNWAWPENNERFYLMNFDTAYQSMTIKGTYPHVRFFHFVAYDGERPVDVAGHLFDTQIAPDPGSGVNPFVQSGPDGTYTVTLSRTAQQTSGNTIHVGRDFAWVAMRIYVPSADLDQSGEALSGGVPLPTVYLGNQQLQQCGPIQKLDDVRALLNVFFPQGYDLIGGEGTPSTNRLWFGAVNQPPTVFPNPDNKYVVMMPGDHYQRGRIIVIHAKAPGTPSTYDGSPIWQPARGFHSVDMRYWSLCNNEFALPLGVVQCTADLTASLQGGYYTFVISDDLLRPGWLQPNINWLPYGDEQYPKIFVLRNQLPSLNFPFAIQNVFKEPNCSFDLNLPYFPSRNQVDAAGQCDQAIMRDYYPVAVWCDKSTFVAGGFRACLR